MSDRDRWNDRYRRGIRHENPCVRLIMYLGRLTKGRALDVAGGTGDNAAVLALAGFRVVMADVSDEAVALARARTRELRTDVEIIQADAGRLPFGAEFDTVVCAYYLDRALDLRRFLKPGGTLFLETFTTAHRKYAPDFPESYTLRSGEPKSLYPDLEVLHFAEEDDGAKAIATFIGRLPN
jgi:ubiquinone/menaquinone biosynthesis C-methylase UbiE